MLLVKYFYVYFIMVSEGAFLFVVSDKADYEILFKFG